jgi:hypothetical protein
VFLNIIYIVKRGGDWNNARQRLKDFTFSALNTTTSENGVNPLDVFRHTYNYGWYRPQNYVRNSAEKKRKATQYDGEGMTLTTDKIRRFADVPIAHLFGWYQLVFLTQRILRLQPVKNAIKHHMKDATCRRSGRSLLSWA